MDFASAVGPGMADFTILNAYSDEGAKVDHDTLKFACKSRFSGSDASTFFKTFTNDHMHKLAENLGVELALQQSVVATRALTKSDDMDDLEAAMKQRKVAPPSHEKPCQKRAPPPEEGGDQ